jgi:hypothetical protein
MMAMPSLGFSVANKPVSTSGMLEGGALAASPVACAAALPNRWALIRPPISRGGAGGGRAVAGGGAWRLRPVNPTTISANCAATASASTNVRIWGARASAEERQSLPPPALGLQSFAVISMMIRFAPQQPQAIVLARTCVAIRRPL